MNNIDNIFSKLKGTEKEAPDIWNKIELELNNTKNISNNTNQIAPKQGGMKEFVDKVLKLSTTIKTIGIITAASVVGVGTYLIVNNNLKDTPVNNEINLGNNLNTNNSNPNQIKQSDTSNINNNSLRENLIVDSKSKINKEQNNDIVIEYNINDDPRRVLSNENYTIEPINNNTNTSELIKNNKIEIVETEEDKIAPIEDEIPEFKPSNVITRNGDGINDYFVIKHVEKFPENSIVIFDARGKIVYRRKGYKNDFSAINLPIGTYFYKFEYNKLGKTICKSGSITVMQ